MDYWKFREVYLITRGDNQLSSLKQEISFKPRQIVFNWGPPQLHEGHEKLEM